ncbi:16208_t:CDS:2, partial [Dentiscutata erythropus]
DDKHMDNFYFINYPDKPKVLSHRDLGKELKVLVELLGPETKEGGKRRLKCATPYAFVQREEERPDIELLDKSGKKDRKENHNIISTKRKAIEKVNPKKKHKTIEKNKREERLPEVDPAISITTSVNHALESTEQRFPDEITNWLKFEQKDIWSATDVNIFDTLTPLDQPISFLDGRALKNIVGKPDFSSGNLKQNAITNSSINPTLLKSVAYIINLASIDYYAPFLEKPIMVADNADKDDDDCNDSFFEKKGDREFKYK